MATIEERLRKLVDDNLEIQGRSAGDALHPESSLRDSGISSVDFVAFSRLVADEFGVSFTPDDCAKYNSVGELIARLESQSG